VTETNVFQLSQPGSFADPLTEVLRDGARALLAQAVEAEVAALLSVHADKLTEDGRQRLVRHGHLPEREIMTGIGPVAVRCPRVRDRVGEGSERIRFSSAILLPYARRSKSLEVLIPILYLKGVSTGDFEEALVALLGKEAGGLSASTIARLKDAWSDEHARTGASVISRSSTTSTSGSTASMCRPGWKTPRSVCWSSSAPRPRARRNSSA
jgi:putative transposase